MSKQPTIWPTSHLVFKLVKCIATARHHKLVHLTSRLQFGQMLCYRQVPQNGPPHILFSVWSNALLPPGTTRWLTSQLVFKLVRCFATPKYHKMVHLIYCFQFGQMLCYRQVSHNGPQKHAELTWFQNLSFCCQVLIENQRCLSNIRHPPRMPTHGLVDFCSGMPLFLLGTQGGAHIAIPKPKLRTSCLHLGHMGLLV